MRLEMTIMGNPITKLRPRFTKVGRAYDSQKLEKQATRCLIMQEMAKNRQIRRLRDAISIEMTFHTPVPKSWSKKKAMAVLGMPDTRKPDIDNYAKFLLDVMNNLVYDDDSQVTTLWCEKKYSDKPRVEIILQEVADEDGSEG